MTVTGVDFVALQVRDIEAAADFYTTRLGLTRAPASPPGAVVFTTEPIPFAVREPLPGVDLDSGPRPGNGVALWFKCEDAAELHDSLAEAGVEISGPRRRVPSDRPSPSPIPTATRSPSTTAERSGSGSGGYAPAVRESTILRSAALGSREPLPR